jgi:hypothetical protein
VESQVEVLAEWKAVELSERPMLGMDSSDELSSSKRGAKGGMPNKESSSEADEISQSSGPKVPVINGGGGLAGGRATLRDASAAEKEWRRASNSRQEARRCSRRAKNLAHHSFFRLGRTRESKAEPIFNVGASDGAIEAGAAGNDAAGAGVGGGGDGAETHSESTAPP